MVLRADARQLTQPRKQLAESVAQVVANYDRRGMTELAVRDPRPKAAALDQVREIVFSRSRDARRCTDDLDASAFTVLRDFERRLDVSSRWRRLERVRQEGRQDCRNRRREDFGDQPRREVRRREQLV